VVNEAPSRHPDLVLVHGLSGSRRWWRHTLADLGADRRVVAVDLAGFGARRAAGPFRLADAADDVAATLERRVETPFDLVGHSMGGMVAAQLAAHHPELVRRLVLVDSPVVPFEWGLGRHAANLVRSLPTTDPKFLPLLARDALRAGPITLASAARQLLDADLSDDLATIEAPTLLVWGSRDRIVPPDVGQAAAQRIERSRYVEVPEASHVPMLERPESFNEVLHEFLDDGDL
jgi:pimeloyl-ACP methyl ester carboxylesterase